MKKITIKTLSFLLVFTILCGSMSFLATATFENQLNKTGLIFDTLDTIEKHTYKMPLSAPKAASVDLTSKFPTPGNQNPLNSCTAWAVGYALKSHQEKVRYDWNINSSSHHFSPAYIYNQTNGGSDGDKSHGLNNLRSLVSPHVYLRLTATAIYHTI